MFWPSPINKPIIEALSRLSMVRWNRRCPPSGMLLAIETWEKGRYGNFGLIADTQIGWKVLLFLLYNQNSNSSDIVSWRAAAWFCIGEGHGSGSIITGNEDYRLVWPAHGFTKARSYSASSWHAVIYYLPAWPKGSWRVKISGRQYEHIENLNRLKKRLVQSVGTLLVTDTVLVAENVKLDLYWIVKILYRNAHHWWVVVEHR